MPIELPLAGLKLVVTRPERQAQVSTDALRAAGAWVLKLPVLAISPIPATLDADDISRAAGIIFVSANAVQHGVPLLPAAAKLPRETTIFAIGRATAAALVAAGFENVVSPQQSIDSEGLLALPELHRVKGRHIILVKGVSETGGRTLLESTLISRGATTVVLACYRRRACQPAAASQQALATQLAAGHRLIFFALSIETMDSLISLFSIMNISAANQILLVPHPRVAAAARERGFVQIFAVPMAEANLVDTLATLKPDLLSIAANTNNR